VNTNSSPSKLRITDLRVATVRKPGPSPRSKKKVVIGDGAIWIWNLADQHFPGAIQIVDIYHARQHLWELSAKLFPNDNKARQRWTARCLGQLDCGKIEVLVKTLRDLHPAEAARNHRESLKNPPKTIDEYLNALESLGLTQTVSVLREYMF